MLPRILVSLSAVVILALGALHLLYTFRGRKFLPRDAELHAAMRRVSPVITTETTMWSAWVGFNASHSMGAILFGLVFAYLAILQPTLLFDSIYLQTVGFTMLAGLFLLARRYWFSIPFRGISFSLACYAVGIVVASDSPFETTGPDIERSAEVPRAAIVESRSCFTGAFENYDSWLSRLAESNAEFDRGKFEKRISKERFESARTELNCQRFLYEVDGVTVVGYSVHPTAQNGPLPVVIYNRGGNGSHARINQTSLFNHIFPLADSGYFVIASQYRGSGFEREGLDTGEDEFGGRDVNDVLALLGLIDQSPAADPGRIGMFGWSRGATMSFLAATRTDRLSAIVVGGAPTDILREVEVRPEMERVFKARIPNYSDNRIMALKERSVLYWADKLPASAPILILHGQSDANVTVNSALDLAAELQLQNIPYRLVIYENGSHSLLEYKQQVNAEVLGWFGEKLAPGGST